MTQTLLPLPASFSSSSDPIPSSVPDLPSKIGSPRPVITGRGLPIE